MIDGSLKLNETARTSRSCTATISNSPCPSNGSVPVMISVLRARVKTASGEWVDYGVLSLTAYRTPDVLRSVYVKEGVRNDLEVWSRLPSASGSVLSKMASLRSSMLSSHRTALPAGSFALSARTTATRCKWCSRPMGRAWQ